MDLTISIVTYNNAEIVCDTINSIIKHTTDLSYKIVVYDNNSQDDTVKRIEEIKSNRVEIVRNSTNLGFGYGHNRIIESSESDYYLICNPDIVIKSDILKSLKDFMDQNKDIGMVLPKITYPNGEIQYLCKQNPTVFDLFVRRFIPQPFVHYFKKRCERYEMRETGYDHCFVIPYASGCFMFFRKDVLRKIGGFDENIFLHLEDADISRRVNEISKCVFYPFETVEHLWGKGSHKSWKMTWITIKSAIYYFNKWGWRFM